MTHRVKNLLNAAKNDMLFQSELKTHEPDCYKVGFFWNESEKIMYASIYMGWLIGKGVYDENMFS